jgi:isopenicillin N synthase-like dioxygenase
MSQVRVPPDQPYPPAAVATDFAVPIIDISAYVGAGSGNARRAVATALDDACRKIGFIQITGHGIPEHVLTDLAEAIDAFFQRPLDFKERYQAPPQINRGYSPPASESLSLSLGVEAESSDYFEAFNIGAATTDYPGLALPAEDYPDNIWPEQLPLFKRATWEYFIEARRVARTLTRIFADALDLPADFFERYTDHSIDVLRMNNYLLPPGAQAPGPDRDDPTGMGEHTDYGIVTVLWADAVPGLQVLSPDGQWQDVTPAAGALLVNLGDLTARWTNERWLSTLHRVKPPILEGAITRRRSAAFFHDGNVDAVISAIESCIPAGDVATYLPIAVGDHLRAKLDGSRGGISNRYAGRDAARVLAAD